MDFSPGSFEIEYFSKEERRNNDPIPDGRVGPFDNKSLTDSRTPGNYAQNWTKRKNVTIVQRGSHLSEVGSPQELGSEGYAVRENQRRTHVLALKDIGRMPTRRG